jgi:hypothetical protein
LEKQKAQDELLKNQQSELKEAIEKGGKRAKGDVPNRQGRKVQELATETLEQIPGATVDPNVKIGNGVGSQIDNVVTKGGKTAYVESKLTIREVNERTINQLTNAVNKAGEGDSVFLHVARAPTKAERASLKEALGNKVYDRVTIVSKLTDLFHKVNAALP